MAEADLIVRQGDTSPIVTATITDQTGAAVNLTGATVTFIMRAITAAAPAVNTAATIVTAASGTVQYSWAATDTATAGLYQAVFRCTLNSGLTYTWPNDGYMAIWVEENLTSDTTQNLVSIPDIKDHLNIPAVDRTHDQKLLRWITAVRPVVEQITGPIIPTVYDEWYDGGQWAISLRHRPLITLIAASLYLGPVEYPLSIVTEPQDGSIWSVMPDGGRRVVRRGPGGSQLKFPDGDQNVHLVYQAGITPIPENIRMATLMILQDNWNPSQQPGVRGPGQQPIDDAIAHGATPPFLVSGRAREFLSPNKRHPTVI